MNNKSHEKKLSNSFVIAIENKDVVEMYTLLDLYHQERRGQYLDFVKKQDKNLGGKEFFNKARSLIEETRHSEKCYLTFGTPQKPMADFLYKNNMLSLLTGSVTESSLKTKNKKTNVFAGCDDEEFEKIKSVFFEQGNDDDKDKAPYGNVDINSFPEKLDSYRMNFFNIVARDLIESVASRDEIKWPINVSDTLGFNEPKESVVHRFGVSTYFVITPLFEKMTSTDLSYAAIAEHDALIKLARLTGLNVILVDFDEIISMLVDNDENLILSIVVKKIVENNNSIIFFKKSSVFYEKSSEELGKKIADILGKICLLEKNKNYNYIVVSNTNFYFKMAFVRKHHPLFLSDLLERESVFIKKNIYDDDNTSEIRERERQIKEDFSLSIRSPEDIVETLDDIIGIKEARDVIGDIIIFHKNNELAKKLGVNLSSGILLTGEPGTGKTVVARAMAKELGRKVLMVTGSDFSSNRYGDSISKMKMLFALAREIKPCIVFIDEIDGIGNRDNDRMHPEERRVINKFLSEMSEKTMNDGIVFIGATNNIKELDKAIIRDGRFDKKVVLSMPSMEDRKKAFMMFLGKRPVDNFNGFDFEYLAMKTAGMTIAAIENIVNQSAILTLRNNLESITDKMVEQAILDNRAGGEMSKKQMSPELIKRIAYHEAGHAVIGYHLDVGEIGGVSIVPRANALGMVFFDVDDDRLALSTENELSDRMMVALAGRASEAVFMGNISTGAAGDLEACTKIALGMIQNYGMGDSMVYSYKQAGFDGDIPADLRGKADALIKNKYNEVLKIIKKNKPAIEAVAEELIAREVISGKEFIRIIKGE